MASNKGAKKAANNPQDENNAQNLLNAVEDYYSEEEYRIWKKNTPFLYDILITSELEWPSNTIEWLPQNNNSNWSNSNYEVHRFVIGTRTNDTEPNFLTVHRLNLPVIDKDQVCLIQSPDEAPGGYGQASAKIESYVKIPHDGDINRARAMPQNPLIIATQSSKKTVFMFDVSKHQSEPDGNISLPDLKMEGQQSEGFSLSWNPVDKGMLLSSTEDGKIFLWNVESTPSNSTIHPSREFATHRGPIGDVEWHRFDSTTFGSVGVDRKVNIWDVRTPSVPRHSISEAHSKCINAISFNPFSEFVFLTGSDDKTVALWDMRNLKVRLHRFEGHNEPIEQVKWAPFEETVFASCGQDKRVMIWDMFQMNAPQTESADEPSELTFIHGGHTDLVADFSWNTKRHFLMASVADNNILQIWQQISVTNPYSEHYFNPAGGSQCRN